MIALLALQTGAMIAAAAPGSFDLADLGGTTLLTKVPLPPRPRRSRYLPPRLVEPSERHDGISVRVRGRKVRVRIPFD